jgi:transposase InsO family protein
METCAVDERTRFMIGVEKEEESFAQLCRAFGISRRTGYKWLARFEAEGFAGLTDRSRAPHSRPHALDEETAERCIAVRRMHPTWGPVKIRSYLERRAPALRWPAPSTIGELFDREGLTVRRKIRRRTPAGPQPFAPCLAANDAWSTDFKGWFRTGDGQRCEPLTLQDLYSRYLLRCQTVPRTGTEQVWPILHAAFREFGLPQRLRSDNGSPFASTGAGGLTRLAVKVIKAGVMPERIEPGKPQQNGRLERLHLTLLKDTADPPARTLRAQIERFRSYQRLYNEERPHQALDNDVPAEHFTASPRCWDGVLRSPDYGDEDEVRRVRHNGEIKWRGNTIYISQALTGEPVGLRQQPDGGFIVSFGPVVLGTIEHRGDRLRRSKQQPCGFVDEGNASPTTPQAQQPEQ